MNKKITAALLVLLTLGMVVSAAAQEGSGDQVTGESDTEDTQNNESSNITVNVASTTAIDVKPDELRYPNVEVGNQDKDSDRGFTSLELTNIGSEYIDRVWAGASTPSQDPFATGNPEAYNAGNFVQIKPSNETGKSSVRGNDSVYNYVNRVEFGDYYSDEKGNIPSYIDAETTSATDQVVGQFRSGDQWYFWTIPVDSSGNGICDGSSGAPNEIRVGKEPHSADQFGSYDFSDDSNQYNNYTISTLSDSGSPSYGIVAAGSQGVNMSFNGETRYYDLLTVCDEQSKDEVDQAHVIRSRYNPTAATADDIVGNGEGAATQFLLSTDATATPSLALLPGEGITIDTAVEIPQGVAEGQVGEGQVTFYVTSDVSEDTTS